MNELSPREWEVAQLVAQALTNPQIAEYLGISPRTVSGYMQNIFAKLNIESRVVLALMVIDYQKSLASPR